MPDGAIEYLAVNPLDHMESEYGIFVTDAGQDIEKKQKVESLAQSMIQNGVPATIVAEAIDSDSFTQIKEKIAKAEKLTQQLQQAQEKAKNEIAQKQIEIQKEKMAFEADQNDKNRATQIEVALIQAEANDLNSKLQNALQQAEIKRKTTADENKSTYEKGKLYVDQKKIDADIQMNNADNKVEKDKISAMSKTKNNGSN